MGLETSQKPKFSIANGWYSVAFRLEEKSGDFQSNDKSLPQRPNRLRAHRRHIRRGALTRGEGFSATPEADPGSPAP